MSVLAADGFEAAGVAAGIKGAGRLDVALVATADRSAVTAAGVFTNNRVQAAPVQISRRHVKDGRGAAVILNSGNANAATGEAGRADAERTCEIVAEELGCAPKDVLVCSTGLIGFPLPMANVETGARRAAKELGFGSESAQRAADAILTTDTVRKEAVATFEAEPGVTATVGGMAKGAAMLSPAMATMLAVLTTDARVSQSALREALRLAVAPSFNELAVDGAQSTNDTVLVLASGAVGERALTPGGPAFHGLVTAMSAVCASLSDQMAHDAEGGTKVARIVVRGARTKDEARLAARAVANSQLVQCSLNGEDPYWGRVLSEMGASGARFDPETVAIAYDDIVVCRDGIAADHDADALAIEMAKADLVIDCDLQSGPGRATVVFTDLSHAYVDENRGTS